MSSGVSVTGASSDVVALIVTAVAIVEIVPTVGDGEGARGGAVSVGLATSRSFTSSNVSKGSDADTALDGSFEGVLVSCGGKDATISDSEETSVRAALDRLGSDEGEDGDVGDRGSSAFPSANILLGVDLERTRVVESLGPGKLSRDRRSSKTGGGPWRLTSEADANAATASGPYGTPNLLTDCTDEISLSCSGVGPERGYTKSVRTAVCVSGAEIELIDMVDGEVRPAATFDIAREPGRDTVRPNAEEVILRADPEPDCVTRWPTRGERVRIGRKDRFDGRGEGEEAATSTDGRKVRVRCGVA